MQDMACQILEYVSCSRRGGKFVEEMDVVSGGRQRKKKTATLRRILFVI